MSCVYVSSRRSDSASIPGRIINGLSEAFGRENIAVSGDAVLRNEIEQMISNCDILLVIIGAQWTTIVNQYGFSSLFDPDDFVRLEIETALRTRRKIFPVLVNTAVMPSATQLPGSLVDLTTKPAILVRDGEGTFVGDMERLIESVRKGEVVANTAALTDPIAEENAHAHHVFLSYSRKDTPAMQRIRDDLRALSLDVWTDETLEAGTSAWERAISAAIRSTGCLVVILSPDAEQSTWVARELAMAETLDKRIFPILVRGSERDAVPFRLMSHQWVDARHNYQDAFDKLLAAISKYLHL